MQRRRTRDTRKKKILREVISGVVHLYPLCTNFHVVQLGDCIQGCLYHEHSSQTSSSIRMDSKNHDVKKRQAAQGKEICKAARDLWFSNFDTYIWHLFCFKVNKTIAIWVAQRISGHLVWSQESGVNKPHKPNESKWMQMIWLWLSKQECQEHPKRVAYLYLATNSFIYLRILKGAPCKIGYRQKRWRCHVKPVDSWQRANWLVCMECSLCTRCLSCKHFGTLICLLAALLSMFLSRFAT